MSAFIQSVLMIAAGLCFCFFAGLLWPSGGLCGVMIIVGALFASLGLMYGCSEAFADGQDYNASEDDN